MSFVIISFITFESDIAMNIIKTKVIFFCFYHTQQEYDNNVHISFKSNPEQTYFAAVFSLAIHFIIPSHCSDSYTPNSTNMSVFICWNLMLIQVSISIGIFYFSMVHLYTCTVCAMISQRQSQVIRSIATKLENLIYLVVLRRFWLYTPVSKLKVTIQFISTNGLYRVYKLSFVRIQRPLSGNIFDTN